MEGCLYTSELWILLQTKNQTASQASSSMLLVGRAPQKPVEHDQLDLTLSIGGKVMPTRMEEFHSALGVQIRKILTVCFVKKTQIIIKFHCGSECLTPS